MIGKLEKRTYGFVERNPRLLRTGVQPVAARQKAHGLQVASDVGPLRRPVRFLARKEQCNRRAEESIVACVLLVARRLVFARDIDALVEELADLEAACLVGLAERRR